MNCPKCGLPQELCVCADMTRAGQKIRVRADRRRYGKFVTVISGFDTSDVGQLAKDLKKKMACGGTLKDKVIELQGHHVNRVKKILVEMGFSEDMIDVA
ncbi:translation initiation factor [Candidatus Altiarchaeota archaeon]